MGNEYIYAFYAPCLAVKVNVITARACKNKRTARMFVSAH